MKLSRKYKNSLFGIALLCVAIGGNALTLGRVRGAVLLGQPLEVTIAVQQNADEEAVGQCFEADVFHADTKLDAAKVRIKVEPGPAPQTSVVRVSSVANVDEPVVTIYLRAGCGQKIARRYVLLADPASDVVPPLTLAASLSSAAPMPSVGVAVPAIPAMAALSGPSASGNSVQSFARKPGMFVPNAPRVAALVPAAIAAQKSVVRKQKTDSRGVGAHLKLDLAELTADSVVSLRLSPELSMAAVGNEKLRAEAVALWRALNAKPEDVLRDAGKVEALEGDVKALRTLSGKNLESVSDLRARLQKAESERFANGLVYALLAGLVFASAAAAYFWNRQRGRLSGADDWWETAHATPDSAGNSRSGSLGLGADSRFPETGAQALGADVGVRVRSLTAVDIDLSVDESLFSSLKDARVHPHQVGGRSADAVETRMPTLAGTEVTRPQDLPHDFSPSMAGTLRAINAEEVFDIRQQAEFFLSLGQYDRAIQVLENRIDDHGESSPFVYLDLLKVFHTLGRKAEFQKFRQDFNLLFKGNVPEFSKFNDEGKSLDAYPAALARVSEVWHSPKAQEFIEDCIFRNAGDDQSAGFDLAAFSELLFLHAIAKRLSGESTGTEDSRYAVLTRDPGKTYADPVQVTEPVPLASLSGLQSVDFELDLLDEHLAPNALPAGTHVHLDGDDNLIDFELTPEIRWPKQGLQ